MRHDRPVPVDREVPALEEIIPHPRLREYWLAQRWCVERCILPQPPRRHGSGLLLWNPEVRPLEKEAVQQMHSRKRLVGKQPLPVAMGALPDTSTADASPPVLNFTSSSQMRKELAEGQRSDPKWRETIELLEGKRLWQIVGLSLIHI